MIVRVIISVVAIIFTLIYTITNHVVEQAKKPEIKIVESKPDRNVIQLYQTNKMHVKDKQVMCLARNIFFEAGIEDRLGKYAVGQVTINRLNHGYWGNTICDVVYSKAQFSWTKSKKLRRAKVRGENWEESYHVALAMINGIRVRNLERALFYHATYVNPFWTLSESKVAQIGKHIFYERAEGSWLAID